MQTTTSTKDLDRADVFGPSAFETRYQFDWQRERHPIRELDPQRVGVKDLRWR